MSAPFVITGATGHVGSAAAEALLAAGHQVRAVVRNSTKAERLKALGAELVVGDLSDQAALTGAVRGAAGVFLISPPDLTATNFIEERKRLTQKQVDTLAAERVPHVVLLSSMGAQLPSGTGPIVSLHNAEGQLRASGLAATFVRAGYFVENWGAVLEVAKNSGALPSFLRPDQRIPMVSTRDIGTTVAQALIDGPRGIRVIELGGPSHASADDIAAALTRILGKEVAVAAAPLDAVVPTFVSFGASAEGAALYREMYEGIATGRVVTGSGEHVAGTITPEETLREMLA